MCLELSCERGVCIIIIITTPISATGVQAGASVGYAETVTSERSKRLH